MGGDRLLDSLRLTGAKNKKTNMRMSKADGVIRGGYCYCYCHRLGSSAPPLLLNVAALGATVVVGVLGATVVVES